MPAAQTTRSASQHGAARRVHAVGVDRGDALAGAHGDIEPGEKLGRGRRDVFRQRRQHARRRLDDRQADVAFRVQVFEPVARMRAGAVADFGRELDAGRSRADDHDLDRGRFAARRALVGANACRHQPAMEPLGIGGLVERDRALGNAGNAEIVVDAADAEHERVVGHGALRQHFRAVVVAHDAELQFAPRAVEPHDRALAEAEVMPVRHQEVIDTVHVGIDPPRRDFMQQRLPQVRRDVIDERDGRSSAATERVAQLGRERQPGGAAADDHD